mmetsp:Transcript_43265/g.108363  ORF Transcript_43265/g.108363 Transcript_43265/m.108363 type:complete len:295 (-) Transcript_43265:143-1027(-)
MRHVHRRPVEGVAVALRPDLDHPRCLLHLESARHPAPHPIVRVHTAVLVSVDQLGRRRHVVPLLDNVRRPRRDRRHGPLPMVDLVLLALGSLAVHPDARVRVHALLPAQRNRRRVRAVDFCHQIVGQRGLVVQLHSALLPHGIQHVAPDVVVHAEAHNRHRVVLQRAVELLLRQVLGRHRALVHLILRVLQRCLPLLMPGNRLPLLIQVHLVDPQGHAGHVGAHKVCGRDLCKVALEVGKVNVEVELQRVVLRILVLVQEEAGLGLDGGEVDELSVEEEEHAEGGEDREDGAGP